MTRLTIALVLVAVSAILPRHAAAQSDSATRAAAPPVLVTLTVWGFEPSQIVVRPGKVGIVVRDLTRSLRVPIVLREATKSNGAVLKTSPTQANWRKDIAMDHDFASGEYVIELQKESSPALKIVVLEK